MRDQGRHSVLGVCINAVDYETAVGQIMDAAAERRAFGVSALAVHGVMTGHDDLDQRHRLNALDLVVPDGQPVRWALNAMHGTTLTDRVYGPTLTLKVCEAAAEQGRSLFLYGSTPEVLEALRANLTEQFPGLTIAGSRPSLFRSAADDEEQRRIAEEIRSTGAEICLVGLGCPRQEVFVYEHRDLLPMPMLAVGAAFDFHAGLLDQAPSWMQARGLEWLYRLAKEPSRLWRRYLILNPRYVAHVLRQRLRLGSYDPAGTTPAEPIRYA